MNKQELFAKAVKATKNYIEAVEMELFDFANYFDNQSKELYREIKQRGLEEEYDDYILTA